jgi:Fe-S cluster assembly scaffold protein SufB
MPNKERQLKNKMETVSRYGIGIFSVLPDALYAIRSEPMSVIASHGVQVEHKNDITIVTVPADKTAEIKIVDETTVPSKYALRVEIEEGACVYMRIRYTTTAPAIRSEEYKVANGAFLRIERVINTNQFLRIANTTTLMGDRASVQIRGRNMVMGGTCDVEDSILHDGKHTVSEIDLKSIIDNDAKLVWRGRANVPTYAEESLVHQSSHTLLVSHDAEADTVPMLELFDDKVRAYHAASVTSINPDQVFYLMSRGMSREEAIEIIINGFLVL